MVTSIDTALIQEAQAFEEMIQQEQERIGIDTHYLSPKARFEHQCYLLDLTRQQRDCLDAIAVAKDRIKLERLEQLQRMVHGAFQAPRKLKLEPVILDKLEAQMQLMESIQARGDIDTPLVTGWDIDQALRFLPQFDLSDEDKSRVKTLMKQFTQFNSAADGQLIHKILAEDETLDLNTLFQDPTVYPREVLNISQQIADAINSEEEPVEKVNFCLDALEKSIKKLLTNQDGLPRQNITLALEVIGRAPMLLSAMQECEADILQSVSDLVEAQVDTQINFMQDYVAPLLDEEVDQDVVDNLRIGRA